MLVEAIVTIVGAVNTRRQLKTAKINRQIQYVQKASEYLTNSGGDKQINEFVTEYNRTKQMMRGESLWD